MEVEKVLMGKLSEDLVIEIFDRIPIKQLTRMKCLSKGWCHSISQYRRSRPRSSNSNLVIHYNSTDVDNDNQVLFYNSIEEVDQSSKTVVLETHEIDSLSFSIDSSIQFVGSSNGIILCKKFIENADDDIGNSDVYVCNPILDQWVSLPLAYISKRLSNCMALAFDGLNQHHFKVVICDVSRLELYKGCRFLSRRVYSSDIGIWEEIKWYKAKLFNSYILSNDWRSSSDKSYFYRKGMAHWQFSGLMLIYHFEMDFFKVFKLPSINGGCLWESEGYLHFCHKNISGFSIWRFVEDEVFDTQFDDQDAMEKWQRKHTIDFYSLEPQLLEIVGPDSFEPLANIIFIVLGFDEDLQILYLAIPDIVLSYSFETRRLKKVSTYATGEISCSQYILWRDRVSFMMQPSGVTLPLGESCKLLYSRIECRGSLGKARISLE